METFFISNVSIQLFLLGVYNGLIYRDKKETFFIKNVSGSLNGQIMFPHPGVF